jgi:superkiller protein 3
MSTKQSLKQIQVQIKDGELEGALHNATTLLKSLKKDDPDAASVYVGPASAAHR